MLSISLKIFWFKIWDFSQMKMHVSKKSSEWSSSHLWRISSLCFDPLNFATFRASSMRKRLRPNLNFFVSKSCWTELRTYKPYSRNIRVFLKLACSQFSQSWRLLFILISSRYFQLLVKLLKNKSFFISWFQENFSPKGKYFLFGDI